MLATAGRAQVNNNSSNSGNTVIHPPSTNGLTAEYGSLQGSFTSRIDPAPNGPLTLPTGMVSTGIPYTVLWSGYLTVKTTGTYLITVDLGQNQNQQSEVTVGTGGSFVYTYDKLNSSLQTTQTPVQLTAGQSYPFTAFCYSYDSNFTPRAFVTQGTTQTNLTSSNFNPAVIPATPKDAVTYTAPDGATSNWTISDAPASVNIYRCPVGTITGIYGTPINNVTPSVTFFQDTTGQEGVDTEYDLKEVYSNPVTGGQTLGPA